MMKLPRRRVLLATVLLMLAGTAMVAFQLVPFESIVSTIGVGIHQRSVTRSLAEWADEYSQITDAESAKRAVGVIEYMKSYYVPGEGYHSTPSIEQTLEETRTRSIAKIANALEEYERKVNSTPLNKEDR